VAQTANQDGKLAQSVWRAFLVFWVALGVWWVVTIITGDSKPTTPASLALTVAAAVLAASQLVKSLWLRCAIIAVSYVCIGLSFYMLRQV
jgi:hypothetical protein